MGILERINDTPTRDDHDAFVRERKWREIIDRLDYLAEHHGEALSALEPFFASVRAGNVEWERDGTKKICCRSSQVAEVVSGVLTLRDWASYCDAFQGIVTVYRP